MSNNSLNKYIKKSRIINYFSEKDLITIKELKDFYRKVLPDIEDNAIRSRIYELRKKGLISDVGKGIYTLSDKPMWQPFENKSVLKIIRLIEKSFPEIDFVVWNTNLLSEFMNMIVFKNIIIIETENIVSENVFFYLKEKKIKDIYFKPDKKELEFYTGINKVTYIVKSLITKSPVQKDNRHYPRIEKILVDLYCDSDLFIAFQGSELKNIWLNSFRKYAVNISTLKNYSRRRGKFQEISKYIKQLNLI
ncbi:MAG: hypothetical protein JW917_09225 [Ignavibacteria bacterium]|nr:hypothetical protein [Ignavibacteria bacterium]